MFLSGRAITRARSVRARWRNGGIYEERTMRARCTAHTLQAQSAPATVHSVDEAVQNLRKYFILNLLLKYIIRFIFIFSLSLNLAWFLFAKSLTSKTPCFYLFAATLGHHFYTQVIRVVYGNP